MNVLEFYTEYMGIPQEFPKKKLLKIDHIRYKREKALRIRIAKEIEEFENAGDKTAYLKEHLLDPAQV